MIMNMVSGGGGGGSAGLNFSIVGGTSQPSNPAENTIWINTSEAITGWVFSASEPDVVYPGFVWATIGTASNAEFNALKNNGIMLCPVSAKQYISGAWVDKTAKSFNGTEWVDWWVEGTLYAYGTDDTATTGGWASYAYQVSTGYTGILSDVTFGEKSFTAKMTANGSNRSSFVAPVNTVDVSNYDTLHCEFANASGSGWAKVAVFNSAGDSILKSSDLIWSASGSVVSGVDLDISDVSGACRVGVLLWADSNSAVITIGVSKVQLI